MLQLNGLSLFYSGFIAFGICISSCRRSINITIIMVQNVKTVLFFIKKIMTSAWRSFVNSSEDSDLRKINGLIQFRPQFGLEQTCGVMAILHDMAKFSGVAIDDNTVREVEGMVALFINLKDCRSLTHLSSAIFLYAREKCATSVWLSVKEYLAVLLDEIPFDKQSNELDSSWIALLRDVQSNWSLVKENKCFKQFSKLMSVFITLGLCNASSLTFDILGFKMFDENLFKRHLTAFDLIDAVFGTVSYFVEGMYLCFKTGSIQPLLLNDFSVLEMDEEYTTILMWWDLVKNGNLNRMLGVSDSEFNHRLDKLVIRMSNLAPSLIGFDKKILSDKILKLKLIKNDYISQKISSGTRKAPFAIELFGESSQGKTTFGDQLLDALLTSAGLPIDKEYRAALNPGDKFYSNWTSDKLVAILDDLSNEKNDFVEKAPTRAVIDFCNNQMFYAPKAELDAKGKCFVEPEIVLVTTNKKDLDAGVYSNCPYSVQRRMNLVMTVRCKEEFQRFVEVGGVKRAVGVDSSKVAAYYTDESGVYTPPLIDDIWEIDVERAVRPDSLRDVAHYEPVEFNGRAMIRLSAIEAIQLAIEFYTEHRKNQEFIIESMGSRSKCMEKCGCDGCVHIKGYCPVHLHPQFGFEIARAIHDLQSKANSYVVSKTSAFSRAIETYATNKLYSYANKFVDNWDWCALLPQKWCDNEYVISLAEYLARDEIDGKKRFYYTLALVLFLFSLLVPFPLCFLLLFCVWLLLRMTTRQYIRRVIREELVKRSGVLPLIVKETRDKYAKQVCLTCGVLACLYMLSKVYTHWKQILPKQGSLEPVTEKDIKDRDAEVNIWSRVVKREVSVSHEAASSTSSALMNIVKKNLFYASVDTGDGRLMANILFLKTNLLLIPNHYFGDKDELILMCYKDNPDACGGKFDTRINLKTSYLIPNTDLRLCYTPSGGSFKNLLPYLPLSKPSGEQYSIMSWRAKDGSIVEASSRILFKNTTNGEARFYGGLYQNLSINTFQGMCGAVWIAESSKPYIVGFHLGGVASTPRGCCGTLCLNEVQLGLNELNRAEGTILSSCDGDFKPHMFGVRILTGDDLHRKSPMNYLPVGSQFNYYGSCTGASTSYSCVRQTPISETVTRVCGVANIWGPPKFKPEWYGWQKCLANASLPAGEFDYESLEWAIKDYKEPLLKLLKLRYWREMKPLSDRAIVNGIPGVRFIDALNLATSMGYPLTGPKSKYIVDMDAKDENGLFIREFNNEVKSAIHLAEQNYRNGIRNFLIAKGCKKDEALVVSKEKCRIFYGNSVVLTYLVRKYFLPLVRFVGMNPLRAECAVGINCHGREWDAMYKHVIKFGEDRLIGGDYGKYDQKLPSQLIIAALRILIDFACECDYSQEDINVMRNMVSDIVYAYIAMNGDLISVTTGTHISGNSLTVLINSICGSLNMRVCYYKLYRGVKPFREAVSLITYGDDNIGSVHESFGDFNIASCAKILAEYGQEYTMPDKSSEISNFLAKENFEFLKRSSVYHYELDCHIGALSENSIFKSLHCYMRPKKCALTPTEACAVNIDGALREWFNHGETIYERRREEMMKIAVENQLAERCVMLSRSYMDCVSLWKLNALESSPMDADDDFNVQSGFEFEDLYLRAQEEIPMALLSVNQVILHQDFGEVDLVFKRSFDGVPHYLIVEVKHSYCPNVRRRGRIQLRRVAQALNFLQPRAPLLAVLYTPYGYEIVEEYGGIGMWHRFNLPFAGPSRNNQTTPSL